LDEGSYGRKGGGVIHNFEDVCKHIVKSDTGEDDKPVVALFNDNDEFYVELFKSRSAVDEFIERLTKSADEAFGPASTQVEAG
jgi:hypothetical protein